MDIAIGIGNTLVGLDGGQLVEWARRAEARGFSSLASIGRVAWPGFDEFVAFAAAAAVTRRIGLFTDVTLAPTYGIARFAKITASVDAISGGRLVLGVGVGARESDYAATGHDFHRRGALLDEQLVALHESWAGRPLAGFEDPFGPTTARGAIPLLFGGDPARAGRRAARWRGGFTVGGAPVEAAAAMIPAFLDAYRAAGGDGSPPVACLTYFGLGNEVESLRQLRTYYALSGGRAEAIARGAARDEDEIRRRVDSYRALGVDELVFTPSVADPEQVDLLADIVL